MQGEVLAGLQQKLKYSRDEGFCCLVAQASTEIVGVVEVSIQGDQVTSSSYPQLWSRFPHGLLNCSSSCMAGRAHDFSSEVVLLASSFCRCPLRTVLRTFVVPEQRTKYIRLRGGTVQVDATCLLLLQLHPSVSRAAPTGRCS